MTVDPTLSLFAQWKTWCTIFILALPWITASADDRTPEEIYRSQVAAVERSGRKQKEEVSKNWEQIAQEEMEYSRRRHEEVLRRESPGARAAREKLEQEAAERAAAEQAWRAEHPVECAAQERAARAEAQAAAERSAELHRQQLQAQERERETAAQMQIASQQKAATNLEMRVSAVLTTPMSFAGNDLPPLMSPDQRRVYDRASAVALEQIPRTITPDGSSSEERRAERHNLLERRKIIEQLMRDETFIREALKQQP